MTITAQVIADSVNPAGVRLTTLQLRYPRFIHAEFMTHRAFSRNASSSRAIPVAKMLEQVRTNPAMPIHWGKNQPGMQAREQLEEPQLSLTKTDWFQAARYAADFAEEMQRHGAHKQIVNRILEPFQFISVIVTATDWDNFFELRDHEDAQPEIQVLAKAMKQAMADSTPVERPAFLENAASRDICWHLPYVTAEERALNSVQILVKVSTARCARVSYLTHEGTVPDIKKDIALWERLVGAKPFHASPTEHVARVTRSVFLRDRLRNFKGWHQHRIDIEWH